MAKAFRVRQSVDQPERVDSFQDAKGHLGAQRGVDEPRTDAPDDLVDAVFRAFETTISPDATMTEWLATRPPKQREKIPFIFLAFLQDTPTLSFQDFFHTYLSSFD